MTTPEVNCFFKKPPLIEICYSIQFEPNNNIHIGLMGLAWSIYKSRYPVVQNGQDIQHTVEKFGIIEREPMFTLTNKAPEPRALFNSESGEYIIQLQKDRFMFNWRKATDECEYPNYPFLIDKFWKEYQLYLDFLKENDVLIPDINQVEFTYVNQIDAVKNSVEDVFDNFANHERFESDLELESFDIKRKQLIKLENEPVGRLYTEINKANLKHDGSDVFILKFISRVHPKDSSKESVGESMENMRKLINKSFEHLTTDIMHKQWFKEKS